MITELEWEGHKIQINSQPMIKYLYIATETTVWVDGVEIVRVGGFRFTDKLSGKFLNNGQPSELVLEIKADLITFVSVPYKLQIDRAIISQGRLKINNWPLFLVPITISICCGMSMVIFLLSAKYLSG